VTRPPHDSPVTVCHLVYRVSTSASAGQAAAGGSTTPAYKACQTSFDAALKATGSDACKLCVAVNSVAQCYDMVKINAMIKGGQCTTIRSVEWESAYNRGKKQIIDYTLTCTACMPGGFTCVRNEYDLYGKGFGGGGAGQHTG
jgi:hypothetical protein